MRSTSLFYSILALIIGLSAGSAFAVDPNKCAKMVNEGWFRTYKYGGPYFHGLSAMTKDFRSKNVLVVTMDVTNESFTASSDSGYSSNVSTSQSQSTTSTGECSLFALGVQRDRVRTFVAQHINDVKIDLSSGGGNHTKTISEIALCSSEKEGEIVNLLKSDYSELFEDDQSAPDKVTDRVFEQLLPQSECAYLASN